MRFDWPTGMSAASALTFDVDAEAVWIGFDGRNAERPGVLSQGTYGAEVGVDLVLRELQVHEVKATFFVPGINVERHREVIERIASAGHEIAIHGYTHTPPAGLSRSQESEQLEKAYEAIVSVGAKPIGYRSPSWDVSPNTLDLLEARGLLYASNFMDDIRPYRHRDRRLIELPIQWILDDWPHFAYAGSGADSGKTIRGTSEVEDIWAEELEGIIALGGCFVLTMHPQVSGRPSRVKLLGRMIDRLRGRKDVWLTTCAEIAQHADRVLPPAAGEGRMA